MPEQADRDVLPGAEPFSAPGGPHGVLVVHGFTGSPQSMRGMARAFAAAGFAVELPLLPGHGTTPEDMATTGFSDWSGAAEMAYQELASRCDRVVVGGLSMGGSLAVWLAAHHPEIAGVITVNAVVEPLGPDLGPMLQSMLDAGEQFITGVGNDIAEPGQVELAYDRTPVASMLSLVNVVEDLHAALPDVRCPLLIMTSPQDHVVPATSSDALARLVSGPVERVTLERSYHVATLDYDRSEIERRAVEFARKVTAS